MPLPLSFIVPVYESGPTPVKHLEVCLQAIRQSPEGAGLDVIVVDDATSAAASIAAIAKKYGARVDRLEVRSGPALARNRGAELAQQPILVFPDTDTVPHGVAAQVSRAFAEDPELAAIFGSRDRTSPDQGLVSRFWNLLQYWEDQHSSRTASTFWAGCTAVRKTAYQSVGGYAENSSHAPIDDLAMRLAEAGYRVESREQIHVTHRKRWTLGAALWTDLAHRTVPSTMAYWRGSSLPKDLNPAGRQRASVLLSVLALGGWLLSAWLTAASAVLFALLNLSFYRLLWQRGGAALAGVGLVSHLLHHFVSAVGFAIGTLRAFPLLGALPVLVVGIQCMTGAYRADYGEFPDENAHAVTSLMVSEWLRSPVWDAKAFAMRYYVSYPILGLGHWPPLYYVLGGLWTLAVGPGRTAALLLVALTVVAMISLTYLLVARRSGAAAAVAVTALVLFNRHFVDAISLVMLDIAAALAVLVALLAWASYLEQPSAARAVIFGLTASACLLLKQSTLVLIPVPLLSIVALRNWGMLRRVDFWIPPILVAALAGPWHWYAMKTLYVDPARWGGFAQGAVNWRLPLVTAGVALSLAALAGAVLAARKGFDSMEAACVALVGSGLLCVPLVGALKEPRHLLLLLPAFAVLAGEALKRRWAWVAAVLLLAAAMDFHWTVRPAAQYRPMVAKLSAIRPGPVLLAASDLSETRLIAAIASERPAPGRQWLRGSKMLARVTWNGKVLEETYPTLERMEQALGTAGLAAVVTIARPQGEVVGYFETLRMALERHPAEWRRQDLGAGAVIYEWKGPEDLRGRRIPFYLPRLGRVVGE